MSPGPDPPHVEALPLLLLRVATRPFRRLEAFQASEAEVVLDRRRALQEEIEVEAEKLNQALYRAAGPPEPDAGAEAARARLAVVAIKRSVYNRRRLDEEALAAAESRLEPTLRDRLVAFDRRLGEVEDLGRHYESSFANDLARVRRRLLEATRRTDFEAAIRLVGRSLLAALRRLPEAEAWRHDERHVAATLAAYLYRATVKTSPHGLFCATTLADWAPEDVPPDAGRPGVSGENRLRLDTLLHVVEARKVASCLGSQPAVWPALVPRVNPTLSSEEDAWTFWRPASLAREDNDEILRRIARHPVAKIFVEKAGNTQLSASELIAAVAESTEIPEQELAPFFAKLADAGLLSQEIEIPYTCRRPLAFLAETVRTAGCAPDWLPEVEAIESNVDKLSELPPGARIPAMDDLAERLDALPHTRPLEKDELFRVDAASGLSVSLPPQILTDLRRTLRVYSRLFGAIHPRPVLRHSLAKRFLAEHGADREVPFLEVYRRSSGASRAAPGKDPRLGFPAPPSGTGEDERAARSAFDQAQTFFASKAEEAEAQGVDEVALSDRDWQHLLGDAAEPSWEAGVLFQVAAARQEDLAAGRYRLTLNDLFTGFGVALARFASLHGGDSAPEAGANPVVQELARVAERFRRPDAVLAEITYNHWGRAANAGLRIPFLQHEIELLGEKASEGATVIPLAELSLRWDSQRERLVLTWRRGQGEKPTEVVPVISSGVSPEGIVALLVGVGRQEIQPLSYFPGFDVDGVLRWPRFVHGRTVLFRRRWIFPPGTRPEPPTEDLDPDLLLGRFFAEVHAWRRREDLPQHVFVRTDRDPKPFPVDLSSPLSVDLLRRTLGPPSESSPQGGPVPTLHVTEMSPGPEELWVHDAQGRYAAEFLVQMSSVV